MIYGMYNSANSYISLKVNRSSQNDHNTHQFYWIPNKFFTICGLVFSIEV